MKNKIIVTGSSGLIGSRLVKDLADRYEIIGFDYADKKMPIDITNMEVLKEAFDKYSEANYVVHLAAYTDVTGAFLQSGDKDGAAYKINVDGTRNIARCAKEFGQRMIHMSTAYVFSGDKETSYTEEDDFSPIEWYGQTKAWAEEAVIDSTDDYVILRIDQPFRSDTFPKLDNVHRIIKSLEDDTLYPQFTNHFFGPTYINDLTLVIGEFINKGYTGLYHASSGEAWSDFEFAKAINDILKLGKEIKAGNLDAYLQTANRPYQKNTALNCARLKNMIETKLHTVREAIAQIEQP